MINIKQLINSIIKNCKAMVDLQPGFFADIHDANYLGVWFRYTKSEIKRYRKNAPKHRKSYIHFKKTSQRH